MPERVPVSRLDGARSRPGARAERTGARGEGGRVAIHLVERDDRRRKLRCAGQAARELDPEDRALAEPAGDRDAPAEGVDQLLHDAQTEAHAARLARTARAHLPEGLEDRAQLLGRDARAAVANLDRDPAR